MGLNLPPPSRIILGTIKSRQKLNLFYLNGKVDIDSCKLHVNNDLLFNDSNVLNDQQKKEFDHWKHTRFSHLRFTFKRTIQVL